jgi:hypothetical protein
VKTDHYLATVRQHYPDAQPTEQSVERFFDIVRSRYGLQPSQLVLGDSVCSDDVNSVEYPQRAHEMVGPFKLGGLDGFPAAGLTGMGAFAAHVPDDGAVFIYHAPHIGITADGSLGTIRRSGQHVPSGCCGACRAALAKLQSGAIVPDDVSALDYQQNLLEQILLREQTRVLSASAPLKEATEVIQEAIAARIDVLTARTTFKARHLILMGAVLINGDHGMGSFNAPRRLLAIDLTTGERTDLLSELLRS